MFASSREQDMAINRGRVEKTVRTSVETISGTDIDLEAILKKHFGLSDDAKVSFEHASAGNGGFLKGFTITETEVEEFED
jgi:predicted sugar kinase